MMALDIVKSEVDLSDKKLLPLRFPMTYSEAERKESHAKAAREIAVCLDAGEDVALLTLGDPSVYATACYVEQILREQGYETEVIPGVPSFCASAAALKTALVEDREELTLVPAAAGREELVRALDTPGTKVIMKSGTRILEVLAVLEEKGLLTQTFFAKDVGLAEELLGPVSDLPEDPGYFVTLIVTDRK